MEKCYIDNEENKIEREKIMKVIKNKIKSKILTLSSIFI